MAVHPYLALEHPIRLAHRGSRILWPENTMYAFAEAVEGLGYRYLEIDVRMTRDRVVVVHHDATVDRTTNGTGPLLAYSWEELSRLDAAHRFDPEHDFPLRGKGIGVPRLAEVLSTWPEVHLNIDLKAPGIEWAVAEEIWRHDATDRVLIGSFHDRRIARFRRITKGEVAVSAGPRAVATLYAASRLGRTFSRGYAAFQLPHDHRVLRIDERLVAAVHAAGAQLHLWTVNEPEDMHRFLDLGVDGIVTDRPDLLDEVVAARNADG
ncbi:MAG TPA: glycerophosphodiester phosphodiesterase [Actinobacteria bacterium]|nr:glycerophosphodiester phosphodiesterase [Actinomycetota bacterium]